MDRRHRLLKRLRAWKASPSGGNIWQIGAFAASTGRLFLEVLRWIGGDSDQI